MPLPVIARTVRAAIRGHCESGQAWQNVLHFQLASGTWDATNRGLLDAQIDKLYFGTPYASGVAILGLCANGVVLDDVTYLALDGVAASETLSHARVGTQAAGSSLPSECSIVVTLRTGLRGRSHRGRVFLPPFYFSERVAGGVFNGTDLTALRNQFVGFNTALTAAGITHVVASYLLGTVTPITSYTIDNKFDVMRGRK